MNTITKAKVAELESIAKSINAEIEKAEDVSWIFRVDFVEYEEENEDTGEEEKFVEIIYNSFKTASAKDENEVYNEIQALNKRFSALIEGFAVEYLSFDSTEGHGHTWSAKII